MADQLIETFSQYHYSDFNYNFRKIGFAGRHQYVVEEDSARLLLTPNSEYRVPYIANPPAGSAFVWWAGIQGFDLQGNPTISIHHYLGLREVDATVVFPDEFHIALNGTFSGAHAAEDAQWFRKVLTDPTPDNGKILALPGLLQDIARVKVESYRASHSSDDTTDSIGYEVSFVRTRIGAPIKLPKLDKPTRNAKTVKKKKKKGKSAKKVKATSSHKTVRKMAVLAYGSPDAGNVSQILANNEELFAGLGIPSSELMNYEFPPGTEFDV
jgi:hypothetical protein